MSEPLVCICQHTDDQHNLELGYCEAADDGKACTCVCFRVEGDFSDDDEPDEMDFDHGQ